MGENFREIYRSSQMWDTICMEILSDRLCEYVILQLVSLMYLLLVISHSWQYD